MVVKNVAGLDMAKLMIGSFGTLAAIAVVNFKLLPAPELERSFLLRFAGADEAHRGAQPDSRRALCSPPPSTCSIQRPPQPSATAPGCWPSARAATPAAVERYERELAQLADGVAFEDERQEEPVAACGEFTPRFLDAHPDGAVVRAVVYPERGWKP